MGSLGFFAFLEVKKICRSLVLADKFNESREIKRNAMTLPPVDEVSIEYRVNLKQKDISNLIK